MLLLVALLLASLAIVATALARAIHHDGYGSRPAPRSHPDDIFTPHQRV